VSLQLHAGDTGVRPRLTAAQMAALLPATRGPFRFPLPYDTDAVRLTDERDGDIQPAGYSYWNNVNNHAGRPELFAFVGRGARPALLIMVDKRTLQVDVRELPFSGTAEGWRFSGTRPTMLYLTQGDRLLRYDVMTGLRETVLDLQDHGLPGRYLWQHHSSADDRVHSATLRRAGTWEVLAWVAYDEATRRLEQLSLQGAPDECQVDKSGRWLLVKEDAYIRVADLTTGRQAVLSNEDGALGHSDCGFGYMVGEDDMAPQPGALRLWRLGPDGRVSDGRVVYHMTDWAPMARHVAHGNARDAGPEGQRVLVSCAHRQDLPRANELVLATLDGSLRCEVVAPNLVDLDAPGGGGALSEDYGKLPKANLDPAGEFAFWTANHGTSRLDAFLVRLPGVGAPPIVVRPPDQPPVTIPAPEGATMNGLICRHPYPADNMSDAIAVVPGTPLSLLRADPLIQTQDPATGAYRPSAAGDLLSRTPGHVWEGRPPGMAGSWEQYAVNGALAVYDAAGDPALAEGFLFWPQVPNL
jgi:hypothetical protein